MGQMPGAFKKETSNKKKSKKNKKIKGEDVEEAYDSYGNPNPNYTPNVMAPNMIKVEGFKLNDLE